MQIYPGYFFATIANRIPINKPKAKYAKAKSPF